MTVYQRILSVLVVSLALTAKLPIAQAAAFSFGPGILWAPQIVVPGEGVFSVSLRISDWNAMEFELLSASPVPNSPDPSAGVLGVDGILRLPAVNVLFADRTNQQFRVELAAKEVAGTWTFQLSSATALGPRSVSQRSPFQVMGFNINVYGSDRLNREDYPRSLDRIAMTGANTVLVTTPYFQDTASSTVIWKDPNRTETLEDLGTLFDALHARGMVVGYKFTVIPEDGTWSGAVQPSDIAAWFASYKAHLVELGALLQARGVEVFFLGNEMQSMVGAEFAAYWDDIINAVKSVYTGKLAWNGVLNARAGTDGEAFKLSFADRLDFIGLSLYERLTAKTNPTVQEIVDAWRHNRDGKDLVALVRTLFERTGKPIVFSEITYRNVDGNNIDPSIWFTRPSDVLDPHEQADLYEAFMRVWTLEAPPWMRGVIWWQWGIEPEPDRFTMHDQTPQNLPSETLISEWFRGLRQ